MEKCVRCNKEKNINDFIDAKGIIRKQCVDCRTKLSANMSEDRLDKKRAQAKAWRDKNKERVRLYNEHQRKLANGEESVWEEIKEEKNIEDNVVGKPSPHRKPHTFVDGVEGKSCSKCKNWKSLESFNNLQSSWDGLRTECKDCLSEYRAGRKEEMREFNKQYWVKTKDIQTERHKKWKEENREHVNEYSRLYAKKNYKKDMQNVQYKLKKNLRCRLYHAIKYGYGVKNDNTLNLLSCSIEFFQGYMESKFEDGMTWENYGKWHVDHIIPCSSWDLTIPSEVRMCFHYLNLQPMWGSENTAKKDKFNPKDKKLYIEKYKKLYPKLKNKDIIHYFDRLNDYVVSNGYILLSDISMLTSLVSNLDVFCSCGNTFPMCYLDIGYLYCGNCSCDSNNKKQEITIPVKRSVEI